ncbi:MAG TPA: cation diffusion facilitator family transporter [Actinomycetota bacterium]|jgi:cobalt-zinc-cadmium efflux system protein|nr:cation diffusion facilitator family transporter [Actinomycetota bacterium]
MAHDHAPSAAAAHRGRLTAVFAVTLAILVIELVGAALSGSLALLADAGHVLADGAGVGLALLAIRFAARPATPQRTFGYYRLEILAAVVNAVLLFGVAGFVLVEAWRRLTDPPAVASGLMLAVAAVGLVANAVSLWLLRDGQKASLNMRGAYLEVWGDLLGSVAVLAAAAVIALTGLRAADPIASAVIAVAILPRTWRLLREAVDVLLEAAPKGVDLAEVRRHLVETPGVTDVHDLHAWTITSGLPVLSVHVVLERDADAGQVLDGLGACLAGHFDIEHSTFQLEQPEHRGHEGATHR